MKAAKRPGNLVISIPSSPPLSPGPDASSPSAPEVVPSVQQLSMILPFLYLGSDAQAMDRSVLLRHGITHIVNCSGRVSPDYFPDTFVYRTLFLSDSPEHDITDLFEDVNDFIHLAIASGGRVLIHCKQGISRSCTFGIAYVMWVRDWSYYLSLELVKSAHPPCSPNLAFTLSLMEWEEKRRSKSTSSYLSAAGFSVA